MQTLFHYMVTRRRQLVNVCLVTVLALKHGSQCPTDQSCRPTNSIFIVYENTTLVTDRHATFNTNILRVIRVSEAGTTHVFAKSP